MTPPSQPTPGPWHVTTLLVPGKEHAMYFVEQRPGVSLLQMNGPCLMYANAEADARLIAAAPRLYDEVVQAHKTLCGCSSGENCGAPSLFEAIRLVDGKETP